MENGQILCTRNPTGHRVLIDYRFELPSDFTLHESDEGEIQRKLESINHIMSQEWNYQPPNQELGAPRSRMYPSHSGFSEDSDYTSDFNFPVNGQIPNAAASQYLHSHPKGASAASASSSALATSENPNRGQEDPFEENRRSSSSRKASSSG